MAQQIAANGGVWNLKDGQDPSVSTSYDWVPTVAASTTNRYAYDQGSAQYNAINQQNLNAHPNLTNMDAHDL